MNLSLKFSRQLFKLSNREQIPKGQFRSQSTRKLLHVFLTEDVLRTSTKRNTQYICCPDTKYLENYLRETHGITNLEKYIALLENTQATKSEKAIHASDTKVKYKRVFDGFFVRTYHDFLGTLHGQPISLKPLHGSWLYIVDFQKFHINSHITIVGVENVETFRYIERYAHLFDSIKPLFLLRYNNNAYIEWLKQIKNPYLHFGDFDLSALAIYITEFRFN
ncbi:MAG: hypothetical protein B6242_12640 [Anaerolineaceae bacterium 4572_78]|nr:MAG: hypothetical protein B6242_12640 [Anaerolineaceae bacterium 4572_78]